MVEHSDMKLIVREYSSASFKMHLSFSTKRNYISFHTNSYTNDNSIPNICSCFCCYELLWKNTVSSRTATLLGIWLKKRIKNCAKTPWWCTFSVSLLNNVNIGCRAAILNRAFTDPGDPRIDFRGPMTLDGKKITTLLSLTSKWNASFHSTMIVGKNVIASRFPKNV